MTTLEFVPFERVGKISFNDSPYDVEKKIGTPSRTFNPSTFTDLYMYDYDQAGISINYTSDFKSIYSIIVCDEDNTKCMFHNINLLKIDAIRTMSEISKLGYSWVVYNNNNELYMCPEIGLCLILTDNDSFETVLLSAIELIPKYLVDEDINTNKVRPFYPPYIDLYKQEYLF